MNTFICYERCTTCKKAQKWLDTKGVEYKVRPIKEKNPKVTMVLYARDIRAPTANCDSKRNQTYAAIAITAAMAAYVLFSFNSSPT